MKTLLAALSVVYVLFAGARASADTASIHLSQVEQIIGGVDGDATAQAVQIRARALGQNFAQFMRIRVWDAAGANPVVIVSPTTSVANGQTGDRILIATAAFSSATLPAAAPDFVMSSPIPASYLVAGSLTFENTTGTTIWWRVSWGGTSYTGSNLGSITNDADGKFGPPFSGPLPSSGTQSVLFQGPATAPSTNNATDYALSTGVAVFANNGGTSFTVQSTATGIASTPSMARLYQNVPNPFNPSTTISFTMSRQENARLTVFDGHGRRVATLFDGAAVAGRNTVVWDGRDDGGRRVGSGLYFYRLVAGGIITSRKMIVLK